MTKLASILFIYTLGFAEAKLRGSSSSTDNSSSSKRKLATSISGACTVDNFSSKIAGGKSQLATYLGTGTNTATMQAALDVKCADALKGTVDLSDITGKGPQFLKNFFDGGSAWNDNPSEDLSSINTIGYSTSVFSAPDGGTSAHYPQYFSNFYLGDLECPLGAIECCYTDTRSSSFSGNADMCALDMAGAAKSNHIKDSSMTYFDTNSARQAKCTGFAYEKGSFGDAVKYNTLFHMAMKTNLYNDGYVKNIPGAPMCGCVEQMPIVDKVDCIEPVEGYSIDSNGNVGVEMSWKSCTHTSLKTHYNTLNKTGMEKYFFNKKVVDQGQCAAAAASFMNDQMLVSI